MITILTIVGFLTLALPVYAASEKDIDKMTTFAVILGLAIGCGIDTAQASKAAGSWFDRRFPPGSKDQKTYLPIFTEGIKMHAQNQASGRSPDTCADVSRQFKLMKWQ